MLMGVEISFRYFYASAVRTRMLKKGTGTLPPDCWREPYGEPIEGFIPLGPL